MDKCIKFLFITGITKVNHVNIFSGLNQLNDISLNKDFSTLCGISESELENYFSEEISKLAIQQEMSVSATKQKLAEMYDGYPFTHDCESVYIFELKMNKGRAYQSVLSEALTQIDKNGYSDCFAVSEKKLFKVELVFSSDGKGHLG